MAKLFIFWEMATFSHAIGTFWQPMLFVVKKSNKSTVYTETSPIFNKLFGVYKIWVYHASEVIYTIDSDLNETNAKCQGSFEICKNVRELVMVGWSLRQLKKMQNHFPQKISYENCALEKLCGLFAERAWHSICTVHQIVAFVRKVQKHTQSTTFMHNLVFERAKNTNPVSSIVCPYFIRCSKDGNAE